MHLIYIIEMWRVMKKPFFAYKEYLFATNDFWFRVWVYSPIGVDWCYEILSLRMISSFR